MLLMLLQSTLKSMLKHAGFLWSMWQSGAWNSDQTWRNIFLSFFRNKNFKREVENTTRCTCLKTCFADTTMEAYVAFDAFIAQDFEAFLLPFQSKYPIIHLLYPAVLCLYGLQRKSICGAKLSSEELGENISIIVNAEKNVKPICMIDVWTKAKAMFAQNIISDEGWEKCRKGCLKFFQVSVSYMQQKLPFDVNLLRNVQFLNPVNRKAGGATSAISNRALKVTSVFGNAIRNQWHFFQNEEIPEEWYVINKLKNQPLSDTRNDTGLGLEKNVDLTQRQPHMPAW